MTSNTPRWILIAAVALVLGACGSSGSDEQTQPTDGVTITSVSDSDPSPSGSTDDPVRTTTTAINEEPSKGTLTVPDGTEYNLQMYMCDFKGLEDEPRYVLKGYLDDVKVGDQDLEQIEIIFQRTNASGKAFISALFRGKYADGRQFSYTEGKNDAELTVDGNNVTGTVVLTGPGNAPLGPTVEVTVDVTCGALADPPPFN